MPRTAELDIPGVHLQEGDHACAFYRGEAELQTLLVPWLEGGLAAGDRCFCVVEEGSDCASNLRDALSSRGIVDPEVCESHGQLTIQTDAEFYAPDAEGKLSGDRLYNSLKLLLDEITAQRSTFVRSAGIMRWLARRDVDIGEVFAYESRINSLIPSYPFVGLCFYDLDHVTGGVVMRVLETHPKVYMSGMVFSNPYFVSPDNAVNSDLQW